MKKRHSQQSWQLEVSRAKDANERRELMQKLSRGEIEVTDEKGKPLDFFHGPTTATVASLPPHPVRDVFGRIIAEAAPPQEPAPKRISRGFTLKNRQGFEEEIQDEPEETKALMRAQYDALRKQHGID